MLVVVVLTVVVVVPAICQDGEECVREEVEEGVTSQCSNRESDQKLKIERE